MCYRTEIKLSINQSINNSTVYWTALKKNKTCRILKKPFYWIMMFALKYTFSWNQEGRVIPNISKVSPQRAWAPSHWKLDTRWRPKRSKCVWWKWCLLQIWIETLAMETWPACRRHIRHYIIIKLHFRLTGLVSPYLPHSIDIFTTTSNFSFIKLFSIHAISAFYHKRWTYWVSSSQNTYMLEIIYTSSSVV